MPLPQSGFVHIANFKTLSLWTNRKAADNRVGCPVSIADGGSQFHGTISYIEGKPRSQIVLIESSLDRILWRNIWNWARRRHNNLSHRKIVSLLFMTIGNRKWQFFGKFDDGKTILLRMFACFQIKRHRLINGNANTFDTSWDYYSANRLRNRYVN